MYVCVCKAITESQILEAAAEGATNLRALQMRLGVATQCGRCGPCARALLGAAAARGRDTPEPNWRLAPAS